METVVIIGAARSGTKFLRDTLCASHDICAVPYDVNYVWRHGNEKCPDDAIPASMGTEAEIEYIRATLRRFAKGNGKGKSCGILLEKTVSNTLRVPFVNRVFPDAKFIHLVRDGRDVVESACRMWASPRDFRYLVRKIRYFPIGDARYAWWFLRQMLVPRRGGRAVWGPRYPGVERDTIAKTLLEVCATQWKVCIDSASSALESIDPERVFTVHYEDLVAEEAALSGICRFVGIQDTDRVREYFQGTVIANAQGKWRKEWSEEELASVLSIIGPSLRREGYSTAD